MKSKEVESRSWEDVEVGEAIPELAFPITNKTMVLAACGTRDFAPYHHDSAYSKSVGNPDMFVNTMFQQALYSRFATDWSGPESDIRESALRMTGVLCPGEPARLTGEVTERVELDGDYRVTLELAASNANGVASTNSITLAMPSTKRGSVEPVTSLAKPHIDPHPEMPDFAREWLGEESPPNWCGHPISEVQISYWCDMVRDANPLYYDGDFARKNRHGGVIAPPVGLLTWAMPRAHHQGLDVHNPDDEPWPPREATQEPLLRQPPGTSEAMVQGSHQSYGRPLRPGDRVYSRQEVVNCSPLKETRVGPGYFQTLLDTYYNQNDEIVGTDVLNMLWYGGDGSN